MYYVLSLSTSSLAGNVFVNTTIMGLVEIPAVLLGLILMDWHVFGRKYTCVLSVVFAGISSFIMVPLILNGEELNSIVYSIHPLVIVSCQVRISTSALCCELKQIVSHLSESSGGVTAMSFLGKAFGSMAFNGIYMLSSEIFPTEIRNAGMGMASTCARIGGILAPYMGAPLVSSKSFSVQRYSEFVLTGLTICIYKYTQL